jgi:hypothetical protein
MLHMKLRVVTPVRLQRLRARATPHPPCCPTAQSGGAAEVAGTATAALVGATLGLQCALPALAALGQSSALLQCYHVLAALARAAVPGAASALPRAALECLACGGLIGGEDVRAHAEALMQVR